MKYFFFLLSEWLAMITHEMLLSINLQGTSMGWSFEVFWGRPMDTKLCKLLIYCEGFSLKTTWIFEHLTNVRSHDDLKNLYLHFHEVYEH